MPWWLFLYLLSHVAKPVPAYVPPPPVITQPPYVVYPPCQIHAVAKGRTIIVCF